MILYRIEFKDGNGCWNSERARKVRNKYIDVCEKLCEIGEKLHAPRAYEMTYDEEKGFPYKAKYYFKSTSELDYIGMYKAFRKHTVTVSLIEINTDDLQRYEIYYQDENQVFMETK